MVQSSFGNTCTKLIHHTLILIVCFSIIFSLIYITTAFFAVLCALWHCLVKCPAAWMICIQSCNHVRWLVKKKIGALRFELKNIPFISILYQRPTHKSHPNMKLVVVFMLAAIPICCYASGEFCGRINCLWTIHFFSASYRKKY